MGMSRGIIIFGPAGSGKTTLGRMTAEKLGFPYFDIDDYIWRKDTERPFSVMFSREEKISRLMTDISKESHFVMAGSMDSFNAPFVPLFDLAVHILASVDTRISRIHQRELEIYGDRILEGGDMHEEHRRFLEAAAKYETEGSPCLKNHEQWAASLPCTVIRLDGERPLDENMKLIVDTYVSGVSNRPFIR